MSDGNGGKITGVVTALFLVLSIGLTALAIWDAAVSHTEDAIGARQSAREYAENAKKQIAESCVGSEPVALRECIQKIVEATDENERAENDLVAQKDMARWAFFLLIASIVGTALTGVGIWFVRENLIEMRLARKIGDEAVSTAQDANKIARENIHAENRSWLKVEPINIGPVKFENGRIRLEVTFQAKNIGRNPAINVILFAKFFSGRGFVISNGALQDTTHLQMIAVKFIKSSTGSLLFSGEITQCKISANAELDPETERKADEQISLGVPPQNLVVNISAVFGAIYQTAGFENFCHTAQILIIRRADGLPLTAENGEVLADGLRGIVSPSPYVMT